MASHQSPIERAKQFWASRTPNQKVLLGVGAVITAGLLALFTQLIATPDYKPLMTGLEPADAQALSSELTAKKIPYQLSPDGKSINVPSDQLDAARLEVSSGQTTHSGRMGFEIFDKVSWGQTEFDEKVNYQRALEGELERTIVTLAGVKSARVHLVAASESVFLDRERSAKASVAIKMGRGTLSREETQSIQRLIAGAVDGLKPGDVSIIDADSNQAMGGAGANGQDGEEQELTRRLMATLAPIVGADHLKASVNVEYDLGTSEESQEKYDPAVSVPLSAQRTDEQSGPGAIPSGVPGTASNVPQTAAQSATPGKANVQTTSNVPDESSTAKTENTTFGVNKIVRHSLEPAGRIRRITAALVVDDFITRKPGPKGKWMETRMKRSPEELKQLSDLAQAAIGIDTTRGDVISVQDMSFDHPDAIEIPEPGKLDKVRKQLSNFSTELRYAMLLVLFLLAYLLMIRPVHKRALQASNDMGGERRLAEGAEIEPAKPPGLSEGARVLQLKEQVNNFVKAEPATSARAVQAWLQSEETP
jgi:flagellar M-ring protein FliF